MKNTIKFSLCILMLSFMGCGDDDKGTGTTVDPLVGTWETDVPVGVMFTMNADKSFTSSITLPGAVPVVVTIAGTYVSDAAKVTFTNTTCTTAGATTPCSEPTKEVPYVLAGSTLTVTYAPYGDIALMHKM